jgi:RecA-family ATPase
MHSKLAAAVALAKQGYRVFPLTANGKTPALDGNWRKLATTDPARITEMWTCPVMEAELDYNIGIALDAETLVFDEDVSDGKHGDKSRALLESIYDTLPTTLTVRSARGGKHLYMKTPTPVGNSASKVAKHIDIKSEGGFTVGPGSVIDGVAYTIEIDAPTAPAPQWLIDMAGRPRERKQDTAAPLIDEDSDSAIARAIDYLERRAPEAGTYAVAAKIKDFGISKEKCHELMMGHWPPAEAKGDEHVQFRVDNAYRYGTSAPGISSPEAEFDAVIPRPKLRGGLPVHNIASFEWTTSQSYLVQGLLNYRMLAMMSGPSNAGKSPLALDIAAHVSLGKPWRGRKVKPSYVLHYSTEGFTGLSNRMEALRREHFDYNKLVPFDFVSGRLDLRTSSSDASGIVEAVRDRAAFFGVPPGLVIIDTLSHALGGGDESNPEHVRALLKNCSQIAGRSGAAVLLLHHPTKDAGSDYRGSSIMLNDIDLLIKVETDAKTKRRIVSTPRVKEYAEIENQAFHIKVVALGQDAEGDPITSVVVEWINGAETEFEPKLTPPQQEVYDVLVEFLNQQNQQKATFKEWSKALKEHRTKQGKQSGENQMLVRCLSVLIENGLIEKNEQDQYVLLAKSG